MSAPKKSKLVGSSQGLVVGTGKHRPRVGLRIATLVMACLIVLGGGAWGVWTVLHRTEDKRDKTSHQKEQLLSSVNTLSTENNDPAKQKADATALLNGGYDLSDKDKATAYYTRANAELNQGNYKAAIDDFVQTGKLDPSREDGALVGQFLAGYYSGERTSLVPILQQLIALRSKSTSKGFDSSEQTSTSTYQGYITQLNQGKDIDL